MTGLLRKTMLLACSGVLAASSAMAAIPSPADSQIPCGINLIGTAVGVADPAGAVTIIIRDLSSTPIPGSAVVIDFSNCKSGAMQDDIQVCTTQPFAGVTAVCTAPVAEVNGVTDGAGQLILRIVGGANQPPLGGGVAAGYKCATMYADGVNMGTVNIGAFDQNGAGGVNPTDLSLYLGDAFDGDFEGRSDYNCNNLINPQDLSVFLGVSLGLQSVTSCVAGNYCN